MARVSFHTPAMARPDRMHIRANLPGRGDAAGTPTEDSSDSCRDAAFRRDPGRSGGPAETGTPTGVSADSCGSYDCGRCSPPWFPVPPRRRIPARQGGFWTMSRSIAAMKITSFVLRIETVDY